MSGAGAVKQQKATGFQVKTGTGSETARTTIVIPATLDKNIELCRLKLGLSKNDLIKEALANFLRNHNFDPNSNPIIDVSYKD